MRLYRIHRVSLLFVVFFKLITLIVECAFKATQAKIIRKTVFLEHVHRLESREFFLNFGLLWQRSKCADQLFLYFLF